MKRFLIYLLIGSGIFFFSCKSDTRIYEGAGSTMEEDNGGDVSKSNVSEINSHGNINDNTAQANQNSNVPQTKIKFKNDSYDFGKVMEGDIVEYDYELVNIGDEPLILSKVTASCGCTTLLGHENLLSLCIIKNHDKFDTKGRGRVGGGRQNKSITVVGNFEGSPVKLILQGLVDKKKNRIL
ncbi:MAG: DUF1573 domain-containing protein [Saprospiraceae bacterium]